MKNWKQLREDAGLTMEEVVSELEKRGIQYSGRAAVGKWESTKTIPPYPTVKALSEIYSVTTDELYESAHASDGSAIERTCAKTLANSKKGGQ